MTLVNFRAGAQASRAFSPLMADVSINLINADGQDVFVGSTFPAHEDEGPSQASRGGTGRISVFDYPQQNRHAGSGIKKIALLVNDRLSDLILCIPALEALRTSHPDAQITLLGHAWHKEFLDNRPGPIDRVLVVPEDAGCLDGFYQDMAAERFDLALDFGENMWPALADLERIGAAFTAGCEASPNHPGMDRSVSFSPHQPKILRYLEIVSLVGASQRSLQPQLNVVDGDFQELDAWPQVGFQPLVVLHPGGRETCLRWPAEKFGRAGRALAVAGARVVVIGSEQEHELTGEVARLAGAGTLDLGGKLSLNGLVGLLSRADVMVANSSGPLHLAQALGTPTVGIYWSGNLITSGPMTLSRNRPIISWQSGCADCEAEAGMTSSFSLVEDISTHEVIEAALGLMLELSPAFQAAILVGSCSVEMDCAADRRDPAVPTYQREDGWRIEQNQVQSLNMERS